MVGKKKSRRFLRAGAAALLLAVCAFSGCSGGTFADPGANDGSGGGGGGGGGGGNSIAGTWTGTDTVEGAQVTLTYVFESNGTFEEGASAPHAYHETGRYTFTGTTLTMTYDEWDETVSISVRFSNGGNTMTLTAQGQSLTLTRVSGAGPGTEEEGGGLPAALPTNASRSQALAKLDAIIAYCESKSGVNAMAFKETAEGYRTQINNLNDSAWSSYRQVLIAGINGLIMDLAAI